MSGFIFIKVEVSVCRDPEVFVFLGTTCPCIFGFFSDSSIINISCEIQGSFLFFVFCLEFFL